MNTTTSPPTLVDAQTAADTLGVTRNYVYEHAADWGAMRLPGTKNAAAGQGRLRFDLAEVRRRISCCPGRESERSEPAPEAGFRAAPRSRAGTNVELLPIKGSSGRSSDNGKRTANRSAVANGKAELS